MCKLCRVGVYTSQLEADDPDICVPPWRPRMKNLVPLDICKGAVFIGSDKPVHGLTRHPDGNMGCWVKDGMPYKYDIIHERCWAIVESRKDDIMAKTKETNLCAALRRLLQAFGGDMCPKDVGTNLSHPQVITYKSSEWCFNVHNHHVVYKIDLFDKIQSCMGQSCDYVELANKGLRVPTNQDVIGLIETMLEARDWSKPFIESEWECIYCNEFHTKEEMDLMEREQHLSVDSSLLDAYIDQHVTDREPEPIVNDLNVWECWFNRNNDLTDAVKLTPGYIELQTKLISEYKQVRRGIRKLLKEASDRRRTQWLDQIRRADAGEHIVASDLGVVSHL